MSKDARPFKVNPNRLFEGWFLFLSDPARLTAFYLDAWISREGDRNGCVKGFDITVFAHMSRVSVEAVEEFLATEGCPFTLVDGVLRDTEWPYVQASESKERVRKHRERRRDVTLQVVTSEEGAPPATGPNQGQPVTLQVVESPEKREDVTLLGVTNENVTGRNVTGRYNEAKGVPPLGVPPPPQHSPSPPISPRPQNSPPATAPPKPEPKPEDWQRFCQTYPRRSGSLNKSEAEKKYGVLIRNGADPIAIQAGLERYRDWCDATGKTGTELVKQMTAFLNQKAWEEEYEVPSSLPARDVAPGRSPHLSTADRLRQGSRFART